MKKKVAKKNMSIDDLAIMVARGFDSIDEKFEKVDQKFEKIDERLEKIDNRIKELDTNIKATRGDILNLGEKFVPYYMFDQLSKRVSLLEKNKSKTK